ncbi:hypothetical protein HELRODRAFT_75054 [Helobdella robusta]|uniref:UDP-N-acetylglucosamine transferase subunit ALG13 n=1 Tax=Helobdella robusta TaxID=6412 RepID=T1G1Z9_HELRO|nr:hypothetical protein HELRODRAFT_75054 [Helobdella robusta]ESO08657.1 hypothetical protein HELRODRAFT_75054 [Helobdella robusta]
MRKVFCTVGTTRFDQLVNTVLHIDTLKALKKLGYTQLDVQIGSYQGGDGDSLPNINHLDRFAVECFRYKDSIAEYIRDASLVISHAGAGSCLEVLDNHRPLIVVINEDLMDNHQIELAQQLQDDGHVFMCMCRTLVETLTQKNINDLKEFREGDPNLFVSFLNKTIRTT